MHIRKLHSPHLLKHLQGAFIRTWDTFRISNIVSLYHIRCCMRNVHSFLFSVFKVNSFLGVLSVCACSLRTMEQVWS